MSGRKKEKNKQQSKMEKWLSSTEKHTSANKLNNHKMGKNPDPSINNSISIQ